jgi:copper transport protein
VGGLIHIGLSMPRWLDELKGVPRTLFAAESFRRFSMLAAISVAVLLVSGVLSALAQFTSLEQLRETTYGRALLGKMGAMLPLLGIAALNAFILQPRIIATGLQLRGGAGGDESSGGGSAAGLQRLLLNTVRIEAVLGIAVLCAVAVLIQLQPARAAGTVPQDTSPQPPTGSNEEGYFQEAAQIGGLIVSLRIDPAVVGQNTFEVGLGSEFGSVGEVQLVRLSFDHADPAIGASELDLPLAGSAKFEALGTNMSIPGDWTVTTTVRRRGEDDVRTEFTVPVAAEAPGDGGGDGDTSSATSDKESIWNWPFDGARSGTAIGALIAGGVALAGVGVWQYRSNVRRSAKPS